MPYRFIHTADVHLDSPLRSLALRNPDLASLIGAATRHTFARTIDLCLEEQVDALVIAGDLYDGDQTSMKTARFLAEQLARLDQAHIRTFIVRGNHDALSRITQELSLPPSVKVFHGRAEAISLEPPGLGFAVAMHGLSFAKPQAPESLLAKYKPPIAGAVNIGILHTSLAGDTRHDPYAPCSLADLQATGFRYWALGHVHRRMVAAGACTVVMPGIPQGRDINESGTKSVSLVTITDDQSVHVEERTTGLAQFERLAIEAEPSHDWRGLLELADHRIRQIRAAHASPHMVLRLRVTGSSPLVWRLRRDWELFRTELEFRATGAGNCWIETVELGCQPPAVLTEIAAPVEELRRLIESEILTTPAYRSEVQLIAEELMPHLPPECRALFGDDQDAMREALAELSLEGAHDVLARLRGPAESE